MPTTPTGSQYQDLADAVFSALQAQYEDPHRLHLYMARVALDHGRKGLDAARSGDTSSALAHLLAYRRIRHGLIADDYWEPDAGLQVSIG